jgi:hypothetical protein
MKDERIESKMEFNSIEEVVQDLRDGKIVVILDDENRENEGDVICAAEFATTENVNFMAACARAYMYADGTGIHGQAKASADVHYKYRQPLYCVFSFG